MFYSIMADIMILLKYYNFRFYWAVVTEKRLHSVYAKVSYRVSQKKMGQVYSVCILQFSCFTKYNRMQLKHKQKNMNIADETLTDYSFLIRYHYSKYKNYL